MLAEKFKKAAEADDERVVQAKERFKFHQDEIEKKEEELNHAKSMHDKAKADAALAECHYGEEEDEDEDEDYVEDVIAGRRTLHVHTLRNSNGRRVLKAGDSANGRGRDRSGATADLGKEGKTAAEGSGSDDDYDDSDSDDGGISPTKKVKDEDLLRHDMDYPSENMAEYENECENADGCSADEGPVMF